MMLFGTNVPSNTRAVSRHASQGMVITLLSVAALWVAACEDSGTDPSETAAEIWLSVQDTTIQVGETLDLVAYVLNDRGAVLQVATPEIQWASSEPTVAQVDSVGVVTGIAPDTATILASLESLSASVVVEVVQIPTEIVSLSVENLAGSVGDPLEDSVRVRVADQMGNGVPGIPVIYTVLTGEGTATPTRSVTDGDGTSTTEWSLGPVVGVHQLEVRMALEGASSPAAGSSASEDIVIIIEAEAEPDPAKRIAVTPSDQTLTSGQVENVTGVVVDQFDNPVDDQAGFSISWASSESNVASVTPSGAVTAGVVGTARITGTLSSDPAITGFGDVTVIPGGLAKITVSNGDNQSETAGSALTNPFVVNVLDVNDNPVQGTTVDFDVTQGGGSLSVTSAVTDAAGQAQVTLTLGTTAGQNQATATLTGIGTVTFTATGSAGAATQLNKVSGDSQSETAGSALASPFVVQVLDANNNPVEGTTVDFDVTQGGGGLSAASGVTDAAGQAQVTLTLGTTAGQNQATASLTGIATVTFTATGNAGAATQLNKVSGDSQSETAGSALASPFVVQVLDANDNPVQGTTVDFAVTQGGGGLSAASGVTDAAGQAQVTLTLGTTAGQNQATATLTGIATVTFTATGNAGAATQLNKVSGDNQSATAGSALANPLVVNVLDANDNPVQGTAVDFAVTQGGGGLSAASGVTDAAGQAQVTLTLGTTAGQNQATATLTGIATVTFTATGNAPPWFEEDWTQFENNGDINALPYMTTFGATQGRVNVETALTGTPWGGDHGIRVQVDAGACGPQPEVGVRITDIPNSAVDQPREIWWEVYVKWSLNYATSWGCSTGSEHKFLPHYDDSGSRWHLMVGSFGDQIRTYLDASSPTGNPVIQWRIPAVTGPMLDARVDLWDGAWHQLRGHFKMGEGDGVLESWLDGVKTIEQTGQTTSSVDNYFKRVYFSSNHNSEPAEDIDVLFGRYRAFTADPGW